MKLVIDHLSKTYPNGVRALHDVSLTFRRGEIHKRGKKVSTERKLYPGYIYVEAEIDF